MFMKASTRGLSLGGTLLAIAVLSVLAFTLAGLSVTHLQLSSRQEHGLAASNAARSVVSQAISRILQRKEFGETRGLDEEIRWEGPDSLGLLTFHEATARRERMSFSTNNLNKAEDTHGADDVLVPSSTVHLVGVGRSGDVERRVEAVLRLPPFPWAIASAGRVETRNGVLIASLPAGVWPPPTNEDELLPADLLANGRDARAVVLATGSTVLGDVETPGQVIQASGASVKGEIRSGSSEVVLPTLNPAEYDPLVKGREHFDVTGSEAELTGSARGQGVVTFSQHLTLSNSHLFVEGDLNLPRGVSGAGVIVATGDISIGASANLEAMTELAVVSGGRVTLAGRGTERSHLRGLFYAEGGLRAADITLVGTLLTGESSSGVELDRVNVLYEPPSPIEQDGEIVATRYQVLGRVTYDMLGNHLRLPPSLRTEKLAEGQSYASPRPGQNTLLVGVSIEPTNGDYPVSVSITAGAVPVFMPPMRLASRADLDDYRQALETAFSDPTLHNRFSGRDDVVADNPIFLGIVNALNAAIREELSNGGSSTQFVDASSRDLSQFLPIEDRIRIVSWLER